MLTEARKHLRLLGKYFFFNFKCSLQYRTSFIMQVIGMVINNFSILFFWWLIYQNVNSIKGYGFSDILVLWGLTSSAMGFNYIVFGNARELSNTILTGGLDSYMLQPKDIVINSSASRMEVSAWGDFLYGYILLIVSGHFSIQNLGLFTLFTVVGGLIAFALNLAVNSLTLYFGNIEGTKKIIDGFFLTFATYPEGIFGKYLKIIFYTLIPVGFMVYMPVGIIANFSLLRTFAVLAAAAIALTLSYTLFYKGLKRYESGNLLENKL